MWFLLIKFFTSYWTPHQRVYRTDFSQQTFSLFHSIVSCSPPRRRSTPCPVPAGSIARHSPARSVSAARQGVAAGRTISETLALCFFFHVYARAITLFEEAAEVVETMVFKALFFKVSPSTVFDLFLPEMAFLISGTNDDNRFFPNSLATGITYCFTRGMATQPIRMANAPNPPDPYWRTGPRKATPLGVRIVFCPIWLAKWASINLARFLNLHVFSNDHSKRDAVKTSETALSRTFLFSLFEVVLTSRCSNWDASHMSQLSSNWLISHPTLLQRLSHMDWRIELTEL